LLLGSRRRRLSVGGGNNIIDIDSISIPLPPTALIMVINSKGR
jgi:hypothetical protein